MNIPMLRTRTAILLTLAATASLHAAPDSPDTAFAATAGNVYRNAEGDFGSVASMLVLPDGKILVGSNEMATVLDAPGNLQVPLLRFNPDGTVDETFFADDDAAGEDRGIVFQGDGWPEVMALGRQSDGKIIAGGVMTGMNDDTNNHASRNIVRINTDGRVDTTFQTAGTQPWVSFNINYINHLIVEPDDKVLIAGGFRGVRNSTNDPFITRHGVARLNANGSLDTTFGLDLLDFGVFPGTQGAARVIIYQAERDAGGNYYIVGEISGTGPAIQVFARLFPDGTRDFSFNPNLPTARWNSVALDRQGRITVTGLNDFQPTVAYRLFPDGAPDPSFTPPSSLFGAMAQPLEIDSAGRFLYTTGSSLQRILSDGSVDPVFNVTASWTSWAITPSFNLATTAPDGTIYAGGFFDRANGVNAVKFIRLEGNPAAAAFLLESSVVSVLETAGTLSIGVTRVGSGAGAASIDLATGNGTALAGVDFTAASATLSWAAGETGTKYLAVPLINNATQDGAKTLTVNLTNAAGAAVSGPGSAAITILDDESAAEILTPPQGGLVFTSTNRLLQVGIRTASATSFQWQLDSGNGFADIPDATSPSYLITNANAATHDGIYRVRITNAAGTVFSDPAEITVVNPPGALDPSYNPGLTANSAAILPDGKSLVVGNFTQISGNNLPVPHIVRLDAAGTVDPTWQPTGTGANGQIQFVSVFPAGSPHAGKILIAGQFTTYNGVSVPRLARLNADGTFDNTWLPSMTITVSDFAVGAQAMPDGSVYVGYSTAGLRKYNPDGTAGPAFAGQTGFLTGFLAEPDGRVVSRFNLTGPTRGFLRRHLSDGTLDSSFISPGAFNAALTVLAIGPSGEVYAGGNILNLDGQPSGRIVRLFPNGQRDTSFVLNSLHAIAAMRILPDGSLLFSTTSTGVNTVNGVDVTRLFRVLPDGTVDTGFFSLDGPSPLFIDADGRIHGNGPNGFVRTLPDAGVLGFSQSVLAVSEADGTIQIPVSRLLGTRGNVSTSWEITGGTAVAGVDFTGGTSGTLAWPDGDDNDRTISFTLPDDALAEPDKTLTLRLLDATGMARTGVISTFTLRILDSDSPPRIITQPTNLTRAENLPATFSVVAESPFPISYRWFFGNDEIPGATNAQYTIPSVAFANAGNYSVVVTNEKGNLPSNTVTLTVLPSPTAVDPAWSSPVTLGATGRRVQTITPLGDGRALIGGTFSTPRQKSALININGSTDNNFPQASTTAAHTINTYVVQPDGKILIGGNFTQFAGQNVTNLVRLNPDFTIDSDFLTLLGGAPNNTVHHIALQPDGKILIAGTFSQAGDHPASNGLVRLHPDGRPDRSFVVPYAGTPSFNQVEVLADGKILTVGNFTGYQGANRIVRLLPNGLRDTTFNSTHATSTIRTMAVLPDGKILIGGDFTTTTRPRIARLLDTGALDTTFLNGVTVNGNVHTIALQQNGRIAIGGDFTTFGTTMNRFTRLNADGSPDTTLSLGTGFSSTVDRIAVDPNGTLWVGGAFTTYQSVTRPYLVRLAGDGVPVGIGIQPVATKVANGAPASLSVTATGFGSLTYQWFRGQPGTPVSNGAGISGANTATLSFAALDSAAAGTYFVRITNSEGAFVDSNPVLLGTLGAPVISAHPQPQTIPTTQRLILTVEAEGAPGLTYAWTRNGQPVGTNKPYLLIASPTPADSGLYQVTVTNSLGNAESNTAQVTVIPAPALHDTQFPQAAGAQGVALPLSDGRLLLGGSFSSVRNNLNQSVTRTRLALFNADGSVDATNPAPNNQVLALAELPDGSILVGGNFTQIHGTPVNYLAKLRPDFTLDTSFNAYLGQITPPTSGTGSVNQILPLPDGRIFISGDFLNIGGIPGTFAMAVLHPEGTPDTTFRSPQVGQTRTTFRAAVVDAEGRIVLSPDSVFSLPTQTLYRLLPNGALDPAFNPALASAPNALALAADGHIIAGGTILRRIAPDGSIDPGFGQQIEIHGASSPQIRALAIQQDGSIIAAGSFSFLGGPGANIARLTAAGQYDPLFQCDSGFNNQVNSLALAADGRIVASGQFSTYRGTTVNNLAMLTGDRLDLAWARKPLAANLEPGATLVLQGLATGTGTRSHQWFRGEDLLENGGNISGADSPTLTVTNFMPGNAGDYTLVITTANNTLSATVPVGIPGAPEILTESAGALLFLGDTLLLRASGRAAATATWQWYRNDEIIPGANDMIYRLPAATEAASGTYRATLTNSLDDASTGDIQVSIIPEPAAITTGFPAASGIASGSVDAILPLPGGGAIISGGFTQAGTTGNFVSRPRMARFNADGTLDPDFNPAPDQTARAFALDGGGGILTSGFFSQIGGVTTRFARLLPNGTVDMDFHTNLGTGPDVGAASILVLPNGKILVGGSFSTWNGQARRGLVRLNANGTLDETFNPPMGSFPTVSTIALQGDRILIGGTFLVTFNDYLVRLNADGTLDNTFSRPLNNSVQSLAVASDNSIYIAGSFSSVAGNADFTSLVRLAPNGALDTTFAIGSVSGASLIRLDSSGRLTVAGSFTSIAGSGARLARLLPTGQNDPLFNVAAGYNFSSLTALEIGPNGWIWTGQSNSVTYRGTVVNGLTVLNGGPNAPGGEPNDPVESWLAGFGVPPNLRGDLDDPDGNGVPNLIEFLYQTNPMDSADRPDPFQGSETISGADLATLTGNPLDPAKTYRIFSFDVPKNTLGLTVRPQASANLSDFNPAMIDAAEILPRLDNGSTEIRRYYLTTPVENLPAGFIRLGISR